MQNYFAFYFTDDSNAPNGSIFRKALRVECWNLERYCRYTCLTNRRSESRDSSSFQRLYRSNILHQPTHLPKIALCSIGNLLFPKSLPYGQGCALWLRSGCSRSANTSLRGGDKIPSKVYLRCILPRRIYAHIALWNPTACYDTCHSLHQSYLRISRYSAYTLWMPARKKFWCYR